MSDKQLRFRLDDLETQTAVYSNGRILYNDTLYSELLFEPQLSFTLYNVTIGINFHWQKQENQTFLGALKIIVENEKLTAINIIDVEEYISSVISSEMSSVSDLELLKAHAIISRSWLLKPMLNPVATTGVVSSLKQKIYERNHPNFDVCADDHCQRYQGVTRIISQNVAIAVEQTRGMVLKYCGEICDTRFHKCCGGKTELFSTCWAEVDYPYLQSIKCDYCNTDDEAVLQQVLNDYDFSTHDFHDWEICYTPNELTELVNRKSGEDYGQILDLVPIKRGKSGRIKLLKIVGDKQTKIVGKELEIRRLLSPTHLYSSNFKIFRPVGKGKYRLLGKGWGHGVGLCQIGAAVMAHNGKKYDEILHYYFRGTVIEKI